MHREKGGWCCWVGLWIWKMKEMRETGFHCLVFIKEKLNLIKGK
jgi:hypothetical protein